MAVNRRGMEWSFGVGEYGVVGGHYSATLALPSGIVQSFDQAAYSALTLTMVSQFCYGSLREEWDNGVLEYWVPSFHHSIIPSLQF